MESAASAKTSVLVRWVRSLSRLPHGLETTIVVEAALALVPVRTTMMIGALTDPVITGTTIIVAIAVAMATAAAAVPVLTLVRRP